MGGFSLVLHLSNWQPVWRYSCTSISALTLPLCCVCPFSPRHRPAFCVPSDGVKISLDPLSELDGTVGRRSGSAEIMGQ